MKKILIFAAFCLISFHILSQSTIDSIYFEPPIPTSDDTIYLYTDLTFPSTGCPLDNAGATVSDGKIIAWSHHCLGAATAICYATDTIKIDPLSAGEYTVIFSLTAGQDAIPCTPGIMVDDMDTVSIKITQSTAVIDSSPELLKIHPNPTIDMLYFSFPLPEHAALYSMSGEAILELKAETTVFDISHLDAGVYVLRSAQMAWKIIKI